MCEPEPCTSQKSDEIFMMDTTVINDDMYALEQSTPEESNETFIVCNEATSPGNYLGKSTQCYVCNKFQRRTPKKKDYPESVK